MGACLLANGMHRGRSLPRGWLALLGRASYVHNAAMTDGWMDEQTAPWGRGRAGPARTHPTTLIAWPRLSRITEGCQAVRLSD